MARIILFLGVLIGSFGSAVYAAESKTLLVFGDSLSAGYGMALRQAWPSLLQTKLGPTWRVVNASQSGETTAGGLTRLNTTLKQHKPTIVLLELGANDGLRGLSIDAARKNLATMIEQSQAAGARVGLIGVQLPPNFGGPYTTKFTTMYTELARQYKLPPPPFLLEGIADKPALFQADQLHPIPAAQLQLLNNVWPTLQQLQTPS